MHPLTYAGGLNQAQRMRLRSLVAPPRTKASEVEALALGAVTDYEALVKHVRGVMEFLPEAHPLVRELRAFLEGR